MGRSFAPRRSPARPPRAGPNRNGALSTGSSVDRIAHGRRPPARCATTPGCTRRAARRAARERPDRTGRRRATGSPVVAPPRSSGAVRTAATPRRHHRGVGRPRRHDGFEGDRLPSSPSLDRRPRRLRLPAGHGRHQRSVPRRGSWPRPDAHDRARRRRRTTADRTRRRRRMRRRTAERRPRVWAHDRTTRPRRSRPAGRAAIHRPAWQRHTRGPSLRSAAISCGMLPAAIHTTPYGPRPTAARRTTASRAERRAPARNGRHPTGQRPECSGHVAGPRRSDAATTRSRLEVRVDAGRDAPIHSVNPGAVAQLVEHDDRAVEARGSIPSAPLGRSPWGSLPRGASLRRSLPPAAVQAPRRLSSPRGVRSPPGPAAVGATEACLALRGVRSQPGPAAVQAPRRLASPLACVPQPVRRPFRRHEACLALRGISATGSSSRSGSPRRLARFHRRSAITTSTLSQSAGPDQVLFGSRERVVLLAAICASKL